MQQFLQNKKGLVEGVFNQVYSKYDLMNDFMSFGVHRSWKKSLINMMNPSLSKNLIDVACGTGDIGKLYLDNTNKNNKITISPSNPAPSKPNFEGPEIPEVETTESALIKLVYPSVPRIVSNPHKMIVKTEYKGTSF